MSHHDPVVPLAADDEVGDGYHRPSGDVELVLDGRWEGRINQRVAPDRDDGGVALEQLPSFSDLHDVSGLDSYLDDARGTNAKGKP